MLVACRTIAVHLDDDVVWAVDQRKLALCCVTTEISSDSQPFQSS